MDLAFKSVHFGIEFECTAFLRSRDDPSKDPDSKQKLEGTAQIGFILEKLNSRGAVKYARERGDPIGGSRCELHEKKDDAFRHVIKLDFYNPDKNDMVLTHDFQQPKDESNHINIENIKFKVRKRVRKWQDLTLFPRRELSFFTDEN